MANNEDADLAEAASPQHWDYRTLRNFTIRWNLICGVLLLALIALFERLWGWGAWLAAAAPGTIGEWTLDSITRASALRIAGAAPSPLQTTAIAMAVVVVLTLFLVALGAFQSVNGALFRIAEWLVTAPAGASSVGRPDPSPIDSQRRTIVNLSGQARGQALPRAHRRESVHHPLALDHR